MQIVDTFQVKKNLKTVSESENQVDFFFEGKAENFQFF